MRKLTLWNALAVVALGGLFALPLTFAAARTSDCPGKVVCPLTGKVICKDQCPLAAKTSNVARVDCPGQIDCPLTGEPVCRDKCPVAQGAEEQVVLPVCCRGNKK